MPETTRNWCAPIFAAANKEPPNLSQLGSWCTRHVFVGCPVAPLVRPRGGCIIRISAVGRGDVPDVYEIVPLTP